MYKLRNIEDDSEEFFNLVDSESLCFDVSGICLKDIDENVNLELTNGINRNYETDSSGSKNRNHGLKLDFINHNFDFNGNDVEETQKHQISSSTFNSLLADEQLMRLSITRKKDGEIDAEPKEKDEGSSPEGFLNNNLDYRNERGPESLGLWHSGPSNLSLGQPLNDSSFHQDGHLDITTSLNMKDQSPKAFLPTSRTYSHQQLGAKVEMVYNLLSMLGTNNKEDMSKTFLAMSSSPESCHAMRQSGCLPLLVQLIHSSELDSNVRSRASEALHNIVHAQTDEKRRRREIRVLKLIEQIREYCDMLKAKSVEEKETREDDFEKHPVAAIGALMKFSFDAEHRQAICNLGGLQAIVELIQMDHEDHLNSGESEFCITLRRYAGMSLTNLTFGDGKNKTLLCSYNKFLSALVDQLKSPSEDLRQVTASVLRNLSWRADSESKEALRAAGAVTALTVAAMEGKKESTLKSVLSALWNLSSHCSMNKVDICSVPGALAFLVKMLRFKSASNTLAIVENAGGIIRNVSSHIAVREDYRQVLRDNNCFEILLEQLRSSSLTIVSNACGTLWNLSARCSEDQKKLWEMGATSMLRNLVQSKHKMISMGSSAALKNLLTANPNRMLPIQLDPTARSLGLHSLPTLFVRKQRALEQEIDKTLAETCDNIENIGSPNHIDKPQSTDGNEKGFPYVRSDSKESIRSTKSDSVCERIAHRLTKQEPNEVKTKEKTLHQSLNEKETGQKAEDQKFIKRYKSSMIPTATFRMKAEQDKTLKNIEDDVVLEETKSPYDSSDSMSRNNKPKRGIPVLKVRPGGKFSPANKSDDFCDNIEQHASLPVKEKTLEMEQKDNVLERKNENNVNLRSSEIDESQNLPSQNSHLDRVDSLVDFKEDGNFRNVHLPCSPHAPQNIENPREAVLPSKVTTIMDEETSRSMLEPGCPDKGSDRISVGLSKIEGCTTQEESKAQVTLMGSSYSTKEKELLNTSINCEKYRNQESETSISRAGKCNGSAGLDLEKCNDSLEAVPNFKIGSEVTNAKLLQSEANKICNEIRRCQEWDLGGSLNSQISMVSCSSFLDAADYSLFDVTNDLGDLDELESIEQDKMQVKNLKPCMLASNDFVSLPSLGSLKVDQLDALDLESSIISVASIVSEIAENNVNANSESTCTMTYKTCPTENQGDGSGYTNEAVTKVEDEIEFDDDDSSVMSQENLPLDPETHKETSISEGRKKITPKEKRKIVRDRYRTYTIRDFKKNINGEMKAEEILTEKRNPSDHTENTHLPPESGLKYRQENRCTPENLELLKNRYSFLREETESNPSFWGFNVNENERQIRAVLSDSRSLDDLLNVGPIKRKELVDNARLVALTLKTAAIIPDNDSAELNTLSDSEADYSHTTQEIDTATYSKDRRTELLKYTTAYQRCDLEEEQLEPKVSKGPKILKSYTEKPEEQNLEEKVVRGRRKKLYSSPLRKPIERIVSTPNSPKIVQKSSETKKYTLATTKSLPNVPKSLSNVSLPIGLQREGTFTKKLGDRPSAFDETNQVLARNSDYSEKLILRNPSAPLLRSSKYFTEMEKKTTRPVSAYGVHRQTDTSPNVTKSKVGKGNIWFNANNQKFKNSASTQNLGSYSSGNSSSGPRNAFSVKSKNPTSENKKLNVAASNEKVSEKGKPSKKDVESKIAKLWKMAEESKRKDKDKKDMRVWISSEKSKKQWDKDFVMEQEEILEIPARVCQTRTGSQTRDRE